MSEVDLGSAQDWNLGPTEVTSEIEPGLLKLPLELLTEILMLLSWKDVLRMRKTCKFLYDATRTRAIWAQLVSKHISSALVPPRLERPIEMYTSDKLEDIFLRWKGVDIAWQIDGGHPARQQTFPCEKGQYAHLVNGGRWYLTTAYDTAAVKCYDLDAETISGVELIPPKADYCTDVDLTVALDVDTESPHLEFTMAFSIFDRGSIFDGSRNSIASLPFYVSQAIYIWRIASKLDNIGRTIGLSATPVAMIPHQPTLDTVSSMSLCGPHIGLVVWDRELDQQFIMVVVWKGEGAVKRQLYPFRIVDLTSVYLLPNIRLLCQSLNALSFEDDSSEPPKLTEVMQWHKEYMRYAFSLGFHRTLVFGPRTATFQLITHALAAGGDSVISPLSVYKTPFPGLPALRSNPSMDADTGRLVAVPNFQDQEAIVIDYSYYMQR